MEQQQTEALSREQAISEIVEVFEKLKFASIERYKELAEALLSQVMGLKALSDATERSRNKHGNLKRKKEKGTSFTALEAVKKLRDHNLIDLVGHNIEIKTKMDLKSRLGMELGLDEILIFMEEFDKTVQEIEKVRSKAFEKSITHFMAQFYYDNIGRIPSANDNDSYPNQPFEKVCAAVARYTNINITKGQMKKACRSFKDNLEMQGEILKK